MKTFFALSLFLTLATLRAQTEVGAGSINGAILDPSNAALPSVKVKAVNQNTGLERSAETTDAGFYSLVRLPAGTYTVTFEKTGFKAAKRSNVTVNVGAPTSIDVTLEVGAVTESVTVSEEAGAIETTRSQTSTVVNEKLIRDLPINGRNFLDFTTLTPGVVRDPRGGDLSFGGQRGTVNSFLIDGADSNNLFFGQSTGRQGVRNPYAVSQDAVQEFQVSTNGYSAEVGRAAGGVVNVITKSGTNDLHGGAFFFYRDTNLNANNSINKANNRARAPYKFRQFGANVGGPVVKNKLFFFFNYDGQRNSEPVVLFAPPGLLGALGTLPAEAQAAYRTIESTYYKNYSRGLDNDVFLLKGDWNASPSQTFNFRWNANRFTGRNFENAGAQRASESTGNSKVITDSFIGAYTRIIGTNKVLDARYSYTRDDQPGEANSEAPETTVQQGGQNVIVFGRNNFSPRFTNSKRNQIISNLSWTTGKHTLKFGGDINFERIVNFFPGQFAGVYLFTSLLDFAQRRPTQFQQALPGPGTNGATSNPNIDEYAFFVQDQWRASNKLTLNFGLRYDLTNPAKPPFFNTDSRLTALNVVTNRLDVDRNNFGPRLGFAYRVTGTDRLVLRGGWGLFYGRTPSILTGTVHTNNGVQIQNYSFAGTPPSRLLTRTSSRRFQPAAARPSTSSALPLDFQQPQHAAGQLEYRKPYRRRLRNITTGYLGVFGKNLNRSRDINLAPMQQLTGYALHHHGGHGSPAQPADRSPTSAAMRRARWPGFQRITFRPKAHATSNYNALFFQVSKRLSARISSFKPLTRFPRRSTMRPTAPPCCRATSATTPRSFGTP
jgi:hypothetical protein